MLVWEGFADSIIVGRVPSFNVLDCSVTGERRRVASGVGSEDREEPWRVTVLVWEPIVGSAVDVVGIVPWSNVLECSKAGREGSGVTPTGCWDISGAGAGERKGEGMWGAVPQGPGTYRLSIIDVTPLIVFKALCAHLCPADLRAAVAFSCAPAWGGLSNILLDHAQGYPD